MDENVLNDFIVNFTPPDPLVLESHEKLTVYKQVIKSGYWNFVERVRRNCYEFNNIGASPDRYLIGFKEKIKVHKEEYLFEEREDIIYSRFDNAIIVNPVQKGNLLSEACNYQYTYLQKAIDYLNEQLAVTSISTFPKKKTIMGNFGGAILQRTYGFRVKNPKNLYSAWKHLRDDENKFISKEVTCDTFEKIFSGRIITKKITWKESQNCLHYFIDGIAGNHKDLGTGIEKENDIWIKASFVFEKGDKTPYDSYLLSVANRKPTDLQMGKLNRIIKQINRQPKERLT